MMNSNIGKALRYIILFLVIVSMSVSISCDLEWGDPANENGASSNGLSGGDGELDEESQITVSKVNDMVAQAGATATNVQVIFQDGLDDLDLWMDFDTVIMARATGGIFDNDLVYAYDGIYTGTKKISDLNSSLYLDTDADSNTGDDLGDGIGAEVRLSNKGDSLSAARFEYDDSLNAWLPSFSGNTNATIIISENGDSINVTIIVTSTDDLLSTQDADAVLIIEEIDNDESTVLRRLGRTTPFVIPIL